MDSKETRRRASRNGSGFPDDLLSNFRDERLSLVKEAIELSKLDLEIRIVAYDKFGWVLPDYFALHTNEQGKDLSFFWKTLKQLDESRPQ